MELVVNINTERKKDLSDFEILAEAVKKFKSIENEPGNLIDSANSEKAKTVAESKKVPDTESNTFESVTNQVQAPAIEPQTVLPTATAKEYTRDEIARAMVQLRDLKGVSELMAVLNHFGVNNLMAIPGEKYNELVAILNEKGVKV